MELIKDWRCVAASSAVVVVVVVVVVAAAVVVAAVVIIIAVVSSYDGVCESTAVSFVAIIVIFLLYWV